MKHDTSDDRRRARLPKHRVLGVAQLCRRTEERPAGAWCRDGYRKDAGERLGDYASKLEVKDPHPGASVQCNATAVESEAVNAEIRQPPIHRGPAHGAIRADEDAAWL